MKVALNHYELGEILHLGETHQPKGAWVVFGGQAGSEGKGAVCGYVARKWSWGAAVSNFMPNAGHTWVGPLTGWPDAPEGDQKVVLSSLPMGVVSPSVDQIMLGPGSVINIDKLLEEIDMLETLGVLVRNRLSIHPRAMLVTEAHRSWERENLTRISSTCKGSGAALADKARRAENVILARDEDILAPFIADVCAELNDMIDRGRGVLVEGSQGFELDINHGHSYPFCTSRQCTPGQIMADAGLDGRLVTRSIAVVRSHPIRVGNVEDEDGEQIGYSGDYRTKETSFEELGVDPEYTTVTQKKRRIFEWDPEGVSRMSAFCRPTDIALTFADYVDPDVSGMTGERFLDEWDGSLFKLSEDVFHFKTDVEKAARRPTCNPPVTLVRTGPHDDHTLDWL